MEKTSFKVEDFELKGHKWEIENPKEALVIFTGMAEHSARYDDFAKFLNSHGYSVYCLDHSGQGENGELGNPVPGFFDKEQDFFYRYINYLKDTLGVPVSLFGHSMGSFLSQGYVEKYSSSIHKAIICGTNNINFVVKMGSLVAKMVTTKKNMNKKATLLHNLSVGAYEKTVEKGKSNNAWISFNEENVKKYDEDPLSGYRCTNNFYKSFITGMAKLGKKKNVKKISKDLPIFIICGDSDKVGADGKGPTKVFKLYSKCKLNTILKIYPNMSHEILNELDHQIVYDDILKFLEN